MQRMLGLLLVLCLTGLTGCATTPYSKEVHAKSVATLGKQVERAQKQIDNKQNPVYLLYAGFALSKESQAFQGDVTTLRGLVDRIDRLNARLMFVNRQEIEKATLPDCLEITAWTETPDGALDEIMGVRHQTLPVEGVQFHPESILTEHGHALLQNFLNRR